MNRIILIGNGFDLAHGLKTKYEHFISAFWKNELEYSQGLGDNKKYLKSYETDGKGYYIFEDEFIKVELKDYIDNIDTFKNKIIEYKNSFLGVIEKSNNINNWVDIESLYYKQLVKCAKEENSTNNEYMAVTSAIKKLNSDFNAIKCKLEDYLCKEKEKIEILRSEKEQQAKNKKKTGNAKIIEEIEKHIGIKDRDYKEILFLNFNYTNTETIYTANPENTIHIHGELKDKNNPMIFGYGDELDDNFSSIQNLDDNNFLENIKSVKYLDTGNNEKLLGFIDKGSYEILVFGHSCGNSDRTLLNFLFEKGREQGKCKKITVFYHERDENNTDYDDKKKNISRQFEDKSKLRDIVKKGEPLIKFVTPPKLTIIEKIKRNMVFIEGGKFIMGSQKEDENQPNYNKDAFPSETPHEEDIKDFWISKYQVTQAQWNEIMGETVEDIARRNGWGLYGVGDNYPMYDVSWDDVQEFIEKLNQKTGMNYRLPTEAEWEYAARGGKEYIKYAGCNKEEELKFYAWYTYYSDGKAHEVGQLKPNSLGLYDMSGNVWEWCKDKCDWKDGKVVTNPAGANRVLRGGSWTDFAGGCAVSCRACDSPVDRRNGVGFRLVLPPK